MSDTVKVHVSIEISTEGEHDTGLTVEQWNALSDVGRGAIVSNIWATEAGDHDNGGIWVTTQGAESI
jgi:hypothetical protein